MFPGNACQNPGEIIAIQCALIEYKTALNKSNLIFAIDSVTYLNISYKGIPLTFAPKNLFILFIFCF